NELAPGIAPDPAKYVASIAEFERTWREAPRAYAALGPDVYQRLADDGLPMNVLARDTRGRIVAGHCASSPPELHPRAPGAPPLGAGVAARLETPVGASRL